MKPRSPICWFGGKGLLRTKIIPVLANIPHELYVEPFGGGASVLMGKEPSKAEVYNDIHGDLVNLFRVLSDPDSFELFYRRVGMLPHSRQLYYEYRESYKSETDDIKRAAMWFVLVRQSFSGRIWHGWSYDKAVNGGFAGYTWANSINGLPEIHNRLKAVTIECNDWRRVLKAYDSDRALFYCDPPYIVSTRKSGGYGNEMTDDDHIELVNTLLGLRGSCVLSGYPNDIYKPLELAGWERRDIKTVCNVHNCKDEKRQLRTECLWIKSYKQANGSLFGDE
jgi:DNA adenine methylase